MQLPTHPIRTGLAPAPPWFERPPLAPVDPDLASECLVRLAGTHGQATAMVFGREAGSLIRSAPSGGWSVHQHLGHLSDLEPLWFGRCLEFQSGEEVLRAADLENRATHEADHDGTPLEILLGRFRARRTAWLGWLKRQPPEAFHATALHPRLRTRMTMTDLLAFVAAHDEAHLAHVEALLEQGPGALRVVDMQPEHHAAYLRLNREWIEDHWRLEPEDEDQMEAILRGGALVVLAALRGREVLGVGTLLAPTGGDGAAEEVELAKMAVDRKARGLGIGDRLMQALLTRALERGVRRVVLTTDSVLEPALRLYRRFGFVDLAEEDPRYALRGDRRMVLDLA